MPYLVICGDGENHWGTNLFGDLASAENAWVGRDPCGPHTVQWHGVKKGGENFALIGYVQDNRRGEYTFGSATRMLDDGEKITQEWIEGTPAWLKKFVSTVGRSSTVVVLSACRLEA